MTRALRRLSALIVLCAAAACAGPTAPSRIVLYRARHLASDLEIGGALAGVPRGEKRFVRYADLLKLPQQTYTVSDDSNFVGTVSVSGVALEDLPGLLGAAPGADMVIAICDDFYAAHYPPEYLRAHHPLLVLRINGQDPVHWPLGSDRAAMGPYLVSHAQFAPAFHVLAHGDEAQAPWGVVRLDFRRADEVYAAIRPMGTHADEPQVQQGFAIARQNCFRCHDRAGEGGEKSHIPWDVVAHAAEAEPKMFDTYVVDPKSLNARSQMAASPEYDAATLAALRAYFRTFTEDQP